MSEYTCLARRYREQPCKEVFALMKWDKEKGETWEAPYLRLANMAKREEWNFTRVEFRDSNRSCPILVNYLNYTFLRLQALGRISYSESGDRACFNTGLQTQDEKDLFATFWLNKVARERNQPDWTLYGFFDSYSSKLTDFRPLPKIATYIEDASDLVFDISCNIEINYAHIVDENRDRLPKALQENRTLAISAIQGATELLKDKVLRNYKTAIPHWYNGKIQLLLPLNITSQDVADLALVADKDRQARLYRIRTGLSMDQAYNNARLLTRPDRDWLNP